MTGEERETARHRAERIRVAFAVLRELRAALQEEHARDGQPVIVVARIGERELSSVR